jgi:GNAT superfamily N-acetyltransferase
VEIRADRLDSPDGGLLVQRAAEELNALYADEGHRVSPLTPGVFAEPTGQFVVAWIEGRPAGCGGVRRLTKDLAEVKRMYVEPWARRRGVGRRILAELEASARRLSYRMIRLETGTRQVEALGLYESAGYYRIPPYGEFADSPLSICFEKFLADGSNR